MSGRRMTSVNFITSLVSPLRQRLLKPLERAFGRHHTLGINHCARSQALAGHERHTRNVPDCSHERVRERHIDNDGLARYPKLFSNSKAVFVLASDRLSSSTTRSSPALSFCATAARRAPRSTFFGSVVVAARLGAEHGASFRHRGSDFTDARATGALLAPRLLAAAAHERAILRHVRAPAPGRIGVNHRLPHQIPFTRPPNTSSRTSMEPTFWLSAFTT